MTPIFAQPSKSAPNSKLQSLLGNLRYLPLLPATAQQAMGLIRQENTRVQDLCALLEKDVTLASSILKLANSPLFSWGGPIARLDLAVTRLGFRECQNLILAAAMRNVFNETDPVTKGYCAVLWKHCFLTACLCRRLNRDWDCGWHGEEFMAGLLHDLGRILLAVTCPREFAAADPMDFVENTGILEREQQLLQTDHCQLGSQYAEQNRLPPAAQAVIRHHHQIEEADEHRMLIALVAAADHMANYLQRSENPNAYDLKLNPGFTVLSQIWSNEKVDAHSKAVTQVLTETLNCANQPTTPSDARSGSSRHRNSSISMPTLSRKPV